VFATGVGVGVGVATGSLGGGVGVGVGVIGGLLSTRTSNPRTLVLPAPSATVIARRWTPSATAVVSRCSTLRLELGQSSARGRSTVPSAGESSAQ
jgi:hypothetical protein